MVDFDGFSYFYSMSLYNKFLIFFFLLNGIIARAQEVEKLNKAELKERVITLYKTIDSLHAVVGQIKNERDALISANIELNEDLKDKNIELEKANDDLLQLIAEKSKMVENYNKKITALTYDYVELEKKSHLKQLEQDSIIELLSNTIQASQNLSLYLNSGEDFLNNYYFNLPPIDQGLFELQFSKVIFESIYNGFDTYEYQQNPQLRKNQEGIFRGEIRNYYSNNDNLNINHSIPELIDFKDLDFYQVKSNEIPKKNSRLADYLLPKDVSYFNQNLPKVEILRNKLFILKYPDGKDESFLLTVRTNDLSNNNRKIVQFELANESVAKEGTDDFSNDIVWRVYSIDNEVYLALSYYQLTRINVPLYNPNDGVLITKYGSNEDGETRWKKLEGYYSENDLINYRTRGGMYLARKNNKYIVKNQLIQPENLIYLFKIRKLQ